MDKATAKVRIIEPDVLEGLPECENEAWTKVDVTIKHCVEKRFHLWADKGIDIHADRYHMRRRLDSLLNTLGNKHQLSSAKRPDKTASQTGELIVERDRILLKRVVLYGPKLAGL